MRDKKRIVGIFEQATGKVLTYITVTNSLGFCAMIVINKLKFDCPFEESDDILFLRGESYEVNEIVSFPLTQIEEIEEIEEENFDLMDAEAEYKITYKDGTKMLIQIYDHEE